MTVLSLIPKTRAVAQQIVVLDAEVRSLNKPAFKTEPDVGSPLCLCRASVVFVRARHHSIGRLYSVAIALTTVPELAARLQSVTEVGLLELFVDR